MKKKPELDGELFCRNMEDHAITARLAFELINKSDLSPSGGIALDSVLSRLEESRCFYEAMAMLVEDARRRLIDAQPA